MHAGRGLSAKRRVLVGLGYAVPWLVALAWVLRVIDTALHADRVPDLLALPEPEQFAPSTDGGPLLSIVVPACNEEKAVAGTVRSLLASRGVPLEVIAVDDRSTDATPEILDRLMEEHPDRLRVVHIGALPAGWLGKPHALAQGTALSRAPFLLFTDADILFREDALVRALGLMERDRIDHLILASTPIARSRGERMLLSAMQVLSMCVLRAWKIADPKARESLGVGAFTLLRREAYERMGGWETLRMEVLEDLRMGWEIKRRHGLRQQIAFGRGLLRLHWGVGVRGLMANLTKNGFAIFQYRLAFAVPGILSILLFAIAPVAALFGPPAVRRSFVPFALCVVWMYRRGSRHTGFPARYALLFPVGVALLALALARSVALTLLRGGVEWRDTKYPLALLRSHAGPLR